MDALRPFGVQAGCYRTGWAASESDLSDFHDLRQDFSLMSLRIVKRLANNEEMGSDCWYEKQSAIYRAAGNNIRNV
jgi:hypothetical protein